MRISMPVHSISSGRLAAAAFCLAIWADAGAAQTATHACASVAEPARRLACYDQAFPPPPEAKAEMASQARDAFGLDNGGERLRNPVADSAADPQDIEAVLARLDYNGSLRTFTLDNGQVWVQTDGVGSGNVKVGEKVRIRKAMLGSYMLVMPSGVALRVKRKR